MDLSSNSSTGNTVQSPSDFCENLRPNDSASQTTSVEQSDERVDGAGHTIFSHHANSHKLFVRVVKDACLDGGDANNNTCEIKYEQIFPNDDSSLVGDKENASDSALEREPRFKSLIVEYYGETHLTEKLGEPLGEIAKKMLEFATGAPQYAGVYTAFSCPVPR